MKTIRNIGGKVTNEKKNNFWFWTWFLTDILGPSLGFSSDKRLEKFAEKIVPSKIIKEKVKLNLSAAFDFSSFETDSGHNLRKDTQLFSFVDYPSEVAAKAAADTFAKGVNSYVFKTYANVTFSIFIQGPNMNPHEGGIDIRVTHRIPGRFVTGFAVPK